MDEWLTNIPEDLKFDNAGVQTPVREHPFVRESPDLGHFLMKSLDAHREVGARIPAKKLDTPEAVQAWRKEHLPKLYSNGLLDAPPSDPKDYGITRPEAIPEGLLWNDERATKFAHTLHKHGVPKAAVADLLALHTEALLTGQKSLKTDYDTTMAALKTEFGAQYDERKEQTKRLTKAIFQSEEDVRFFEETGLADHPRFMSVLMRLAPLAMQDSSLMPKGDGSDGRPTGDQVRAEISDIMTNKNNPKYSLYWQRDKATLDYVEEIYKKAYGTGQVVIS